MRELDWGSSFVDYEPTHSWWFIYKSVRLCADVILFTSCCVLMVENNIFSLHRRHSGLRSGRFRPPPLYCDGPQRTKNGVPPAPVPVPAFERLVKPFNRSYSVITVLPKSLIRHNSDLTYIHRCVLPDYKNSRGRWAGSPPTSS